MEVKTNALAVNFDKTKLLLRSDNAIERFAEALGNDRMARTYIGSVLNVVSQSDRLMGCKPGSIIQSALRAANLQLSVDPTYGHAYLVPYKDTCTFIPGYLGYQALALRTGQYKIINIATVWEGQEVEEDQLRGVHKITGLPNYEKGKWVPAGYMLYFELKNGYSKSFYMTVEECKKHGETYAPSFKRDDSLWKTNPHAMYKKTVMRLGLKRYGYFDSTTTLALAEQFEEESEQQSDTIEGEWMEQAVEDEEERQAQFEGKTTEELNGMLGFEDEPDTSKKPTKKEPVKKAAAKEAITKVKPKEYEIAASFNSKRLNKLYGEMSVDELQGEIMALTQYDAKTQEEKVQVNDRIQAAKELIKYIESNPI